MEENVRLNQTIIVEDRKKMTLTGVKDVLSFDTSLGKLTVKGSGLHIINFDTKSGDLSAEGRICALVYTSEEKNGGVLSRIFR